MNDREIIATKIAEAWNETDAYTQSQFAELLHIEADMYRVSPEEASSPERTEMNQTHDCPSCTEELITIDGCNQVYRCENCETDYFGGLNANGDEIIVGEM